MSKTETKKTECKKKEKPKLKSPKILIIETGIKIVNKIPDMIPLLVTTALCEVVKSKVRHKFG